MRLNSKDAYALMLHAWNIGHWQTAVDASDALVEWLLHSDQPGVQFFPRKRIAITYEVGRAARERLGVTPPKEVSA